VAAAGARGARLAAGAGAVALAAAVAVRPVLAGGGRAGAAGALGAAGVALVLAAVALGRRRPVAWALVVLAAQYALGLAGRDGRLDGGAPFVAVGLLLLAELAYWSVELARTGREEAAAALRRLAALGALGVAALALATLVLAATAIPLGSSEAWTVVGLAAAAAAVALIASLAQDREADAP
jgi:hypothetical protein